MQHVGIILPSYNAEETLPQTLNSVVIQTYPQWSLFFIDDGSTDGSLAMTNEFRRVIGEQINIFTGSNQGVSVARNYARQIIFQRRDVDLVAFIDADDSWYPNHLWESVYYMDTHPDVDFVYSGVKLEFANGETAFPYLIKQPPFDPPIYISSVVCKKKCLEVGEFDSRVNGQEDYLMWLKMHHAGFKIQYLNQIYTRYLVKNDGVASTWNTEKQKVLEEEMGKCKELKLA